MESALGILVFVAMAAAILLFQRWQRKRQEAESARVESERKQRDDDFWKAAKRVRAKVLSACGTGVRYNLMPVIDFTLEIESPDGSYEVNVKQAVDHVDLHRISFGKTLSVWIDPSKRDRIELTTAMLEESDE